MQSITGMSKNGLSQASRDFYDIHQEIRVKNSAFFGAVNNIMV
jgi:hypothetical protein